MNTFLSVIVLLLITTNVYSSVDAKQPLTQQSISYEIMHTENGEEITCETTQNIRFCKDTKGLAYSGVAFTEYENKNKQKEENYKDGKLDGLMKSFYEDGTLQKEGNYTEGKLNGVAKTYYQSGKLQSEEVYINNRVNGEAIQYYETGEVYKKINYMV